MLDEQYQVDQALSAATRACFNPTWDEAELVIDLSGGEQKVSLAPLGREGEAKLSEGFYAAVGKLVDLHKGELQRATYTFRRRPDGKWNLSADLEFSR